MVAAPPSLCYQRPTSLARLAQLATAGLDVLRDEGMAYARRLAAAGVAVGHHNFEQEPHGFLSLGALSLTADGARQQLIKELAG